jgi:hypothetical protein
MKYPMLLAATLVVGGCVATSAPQTRPASRAERPAAAVAAPAAFDKRGLDAVMGKDIGALKRLFGDPRLDVVEVNGRKLQFVGKACVLDTYLYRDGKGGVEIVTHVDARRSDGAAVDRASCVDALQRR